MLCRLHLWHTSPRSQLCGEHGRRARAAGGDRAQEPAGGVDGDGEQAAHGDVRAGRQAGHRRLQPYLPSAHRRGARLHAPAVPGQIRYRQRLMNMTKTQRPKKIQLSSACVKVLLSLCTRASRSSTNKNNLVMAARRIM